MADNRTRVLTLAKVLIAAAWADGTLTEEEKNSLKDLIFGLSTGGYQLTAQEWDLLDLYMDAPVEADERARLVAELQDAIRTPEERAYVVQALQQMATADAEPSESETQIIAEIIQSIDESHTGFMDSLNRFLGGAMDRRSTAVANAPNREIYFEDFLKNRVYYEVEKQLHQDGKTLDLSDEELRRLGLAGGLMARVAHVDREIEAHEKALMVEKIRDYWQVEEETAVFVTTVAINTVDVTYDYYRMTRQFTELTTVEERQRFLAVLFQLAAADGELTFNETEEIRLISQSLNLSHADFIAAKLTVV